MHQTKPGKSGEEGAESTEKMREDVDKMIKLHKESSDKFAFENAEVAKSGMGGSGSVFDLGWLNLFGGSGDSNVDNVDNSSSSAEHPTGHLIKTPLFPLTGGFLSTKYANPHASQLLNPAADFLGTGKSIGSSLASFQEEFNGTGNSNSKTATLSLSERARRVFTGVAMARSFRAAMETGILTAAGGVPGEEENREENEENGKEKRQERNPDGRNLKGWNDGDGAKESENSKQREQSTVTSVRVEPQVAHPQLVRCVTG
jgi:hypothetical protein